MSELIEELEDQEELQFTVDEDEKAEELLKRRREHVEEKEKWTAHYDALKERACMKHDNAIFEIDRKLLEYFKDRESKGKTRKTKTQVIYDLPSGKIFIKKQNPDYEKDNDTIVTWLKQKDPQFIKVKEEPDWSAMKDAYSFSEVTEETVDDETGEIMTEVVTRMIKVDPETGKIETVPGVTVRPREDIFKVEDK